MTLDEYEAFLNMAIDPIIHGFERFYFSDEECLRTMEFDRKLIKLARAVDYKRTCTSEQFAEAQELEAQAWEEVFS